MEIRIPILVIMSDIEASLMGLCRICLVQNHSLEMRWRSMVWTTMSQCFWGSQCPKHVWGLGEYHFKFFVFFEWEKCTYAHNVIIGQVLFYGRKIIIGVKYGQARKPIFCLAATFFLVFVACCHFLPRYCCLRRSLICTMPMHSLLDNMLPLIFL